MNETRACKDCRYSFIFIQGFKPQIALWCRRPVTSRKGVANFQGCAYSRREGEECGPDGNCWESNNFNWFQRLMWRWRLRKINHID